MKTYYSFDSKVPDAFKEATDLSNTFNVALGSYRDQTMCPETSVWKPPRIITLAGPCGTGKTWDACAWLNNAAGLGKTIAFTKAGDFWRYNVEDLSSLEFTRCVVIDDYGTRLTDGNLSRVFDLVNTRLNSSKKYTILTTNIFAEIRQIDERLASRLNAGCKIDYTGTPDLREGLTND